MWVRRPRTVRCPRCPACGGRPFINGKTEVGRSREAGHASTLDGVRDFASGWMSPRSRSADGGPTMIAGEFRRLDDATVPTGAQAGEESDPPFEVEDAVDAMQRSIGGSGPFRILGDYNQCVPAPSLRCHLTKLQRRTRILPDRVLPPSVLRRSSLTERSVRSI